jgi:hypothetical protein
MVSKHCRACGTDAHPRTQHPSSFRTELTLWLAAIAIGAAAGVWSAVTAPSPSPLNRTVQTMALSSVQTANADGVAGAEDAPASGGAGSQFLEWLLDVVVVFLKTAWWVLPIPLAFSIWRQWRTYPVCRRCGARDLTEVITPHGALPPVG